MSVLGPHTELGKVLANLQHRPYPFLSWLYGLTKLYPVGNFLCDLSQKQDYLSVAVYSWNQDYEDSKIYLGNATCRMKWIRSQPGFVAGRKASKH